MTMIEFMFSEKLLIPMFDDHVEKCFRCNRIANADGDCAAILVLKNRDSSFSGTFRLPLCYSCSLIPHNQLERLL